MRPQIVRIDATAFRHLSRDLEFTEAAPREFVLLTLEIPLAHDLGNAGLQEMPFRIGNSRREL